MDCGIRKLTDGENCLLENFLYEVIFVPKGMPAPSREFAIGTALMKEMLRLLKDKGYKQASLAAKR